METEEEINYPLVLNQTRQQLLQAQMQILQMQMQQLKTEEQTLTQSGEDSE